LSKVKTSYCLVGIVENVKIKVSVLVEIKESGMGGVSRIGDVVQPCLFRKSHIAIVDEQLVLFVIAFNVAGIAYVDVQPAVAVDICHTHSCRPGPRAGHTGFFGYVLKLEITFIDVKFIWSKVTRKINVDQAVVVNVSKGDAATIVKIAICVNIEVVAEMQLILERHAAGLSVNFEEQRIIGFLRF